MKHMYRISLTWAVAFIIHSSGKFFLNYKEMQYKIDQQKLIELHIQNKKVELELMNKLQGNNSEERSDPKKDAKA